MVHHTEYYDFLGVEISDSEEAIKKAYRRLALKHHPDKQGDPEAFRKLTEVYDVLRNPEKRRMYDRYGADATKEGVAPDARAGQAFPPGFSVEQIFGSMFGSFGGFQAQARAGATAAAAQGAGRNRKPKQIKHTVLLSMEDLYRGKKLRIAVQRAIICPECEGEGGRNVTESPCVPCAGRGFVVRSNGSIFQSSVRCQACDATGTTRKIAEPCSACKATGMGTERILLEPVVKPGDRPNMSFIYRGKGDFVKNTNARGGQAGDVVITTIQKPSANFSRKGQNLYTEVQVSLKQSLAGFSTEIKHLDGRMIDISVPKGKVTAPGTIIAVKNEGIPANKGTLFVKVKVQFPEKFSDSSIEMLDILPELS